MDLYDDLDTKQRAGQIDGWSSGIKMLQTQLAIKKATNPQPKKEPKKTLLTPIISLRPKKPPEDDIFTPVKSEPRPMKTTIGQPLAPVIENNKSTDYEWDFVDEYDPMWPNEYEKMIKEKRDKDKERRDERRKRRSNAGGGGGGGGGNSGGLDNNRKDTSPKYSGFSNRHNDEDTYVRSPPASGGGGNKGAAIAPPPSLQEISLTNGDGSTAVTIPYTTNSVAAKIMAKYGFKDGQGLGKSEQGMSMALQVEKTSKRGGRIIHEKELLMPPPPAVPNSPPSGGGGGAGDAVQKIEPSITEIMKEPSKVVLLRNMVGPGDVDSELEPEVKDECNTKYGDVVSVVIHESFGTVPEDAVRIFVEFKRIESAIKAVVDLNGRFFGGRQVRAGFYNYDKFKSFELQ
ncbi:splicing factor 45 [Eupeodes corollae]|uniref:splicing factor 45 n=1 Tax=Eupeodes corollae TaxID=290404 RepID=UPI0024936E94|nr:splicing factor 45 [Eupeodes corollae]